MKKRQQKKHELDMICNRNYVEPVSPGGNPEKSTWSWIAWPARVYEMRSLNLTFTCVARVSELRSET